MTKILAHLKSQALKPQMMLWLMAVTLDCVHLLVLIFTYIKRVVKTFWGWQLNDISQANMYENSTLQN